MQQAGAAADEPGIVIYVSTDREGSTFSLSRESRLALAARFADKFHASQRIFIAHNTQGDFERLHGPLSRQLVTLLTGLDDDALNQLGRVEFRDPVSELPL